MTISADRPVASVEEFYLPKKPEEKDGVRAILEALTQEERDAMPDEGMPLRHFRAEKSNVEKAIQKLKSTLAWRKENRVDSLVDGDEAEPMRLEHETGKRYVRGYDSEGCALVYYRSELENTVIWTFEKALACSASASGAKPASDRISVVVDFTNFKMSKLPPLSVCVEQLNIFQTHYPERLHKAYLIKPSLVFRTFWRVFRAFVDAKTRERVVFCTAKTTVADFVDDPTTLEMSVGGTDESIEPFDVDKYMSLPFDESYGESHGE